MYIAGNVMFLPFCLTVMCYSVDNHVRSNLLMCIGYWGRACCSLDDFLFFLSPLCSVRGRTGEPGEGVVDTSPGLPVGAADLFSREVLILAARPTSDSSEVDHVTTPLQRQADSARFASRLSEPRLSWVRYCVLCCLIEILILFSYFLLRLWFVFYH